MIRTESDAICAEFAGLYAKLKTEAGRNQFWAVLGNFADEDVRRWCHTWTRDNPDETKIGLSWIKGRLVSASGRQTEYRQHGPSRTAVDAYYAARPGLRDREREHAQQLADQTHRRRIALAIRESRIRQLATALGIADSSDRVHGQLPESLEARLGCHKNPSLLKFCLCEDLSVVVVGRHGTVQIRSLVDMQKRPIETTVEAMVDAVPDLTVDDVQTIGFWHGTMNTPARLFAMASKRLVNLVRSDTQRSMSDPRPLF